VEGPKRPAPLDDSHQNTFHIPQHLARRNPHHRETQTRQIRIPRHIPLRSVAAIMRLSIHFDRQSHRQTGKIDDKPILRKLLAKPETPGRWRSCCQSNTSGRLISFLSLRANVTVLSGAPTVRCLRRPKSSPERGGGPSGCAGWWRGRASVMSPSAPPSALRAATSPFRGGFRCPPQDSKCSLSRSATGRYETPRYRRLASRHPERLSCGFLTACSSTSHTTQCQLPEFFKPTFRMAGTFRLR
jgi:hypothetical protein